MFQCLSIGINVLSQKHNFRYTVSHQTLDLFYDRLRFATLLSSSYIWYNTVTAEIIAAKHDIHTGFKGILSLYRQVFYDLICIFPYIHYHFVLWLLVFPALGFQFL